MPHGSLAVIALSAVFASGAFAGSAAGEPPSMPDQHHHDADEKLGTVDFPTSCAPGEKPRFNRAVALLHSFAYETARNAFTEIAAADPGCAMAHWGIAMTLFHPIWAAANPAAAPSAADLERGAAEVQKAKTPGPGTERERDYVAAVEAYYRDFARVDHPARAVAFASAMETVFARNPKDREARVFYALALLGTPSPTDKTYAVQKKAAALLDEVLPEAPDHPGVAHYLIHSFDYPALAELALPAARAYAKIAPAAPHALHMPSHIFTRLGLWDESIETNLASSAAARRVVARDHPGTTAFDDLHALDYLEYAYLQEGRDEEAAHVRDQVAAVRGVDAPELAAGYAVAAVPARFALERRDWKAAAALELPAAAVPWPRMTNAEAIVHFARAVGAAHTGQLDIARAAVARLTAIRDGLTQANNGYWAGQVDIQREAALAWIARAEGRNDEALRLLRSAADHEDATEKHPITPGVVLPAREQLADLLAETGDAEGALAAYDAVLKTSPGRYNALAGAARAAEAKGDALRAKAYYTKLLAQCGRADAARVEVGKARAILSVPR